MKYVKWFFRTLFAIAIICGIPLGYELLMMPKGTGRPLSIVETLIAIPGVIGCLCIMITSFALVAFLIGNFIFWVFSDDKKQKEW